MHSQIRKGKKYSPKIQMEKKLQKEKEKTLLPEEYCGFDNL